MKPESVKCPECGGPMLSRKNQASGQRFWGCLRFPDCRGTRDTDGESPRRFNDDDTDDSATETPSARMSRNDSRRWDGGES